MGSSQWKCVFLLRDSAFPYFLRFMTWFCRRGSFAWETVFFCCPQNGPFHIGSQVGRPLPPPARPLVFTNCFCLENTEHFQSCFFLFVTDLEEIIAGHYRFLRCAVFACAWFSDVGVPDSQQIENIKQLTSKHRTPEHATIRLPHNCPVPLVSKSPQPDIHSEKRNVILCFREVVNKEVW